MMNRKHFLFFIGMIGIAQLWGQEPGGSIKIGFMGSGLDTHISEAAVQFLDNQSYQVVSISDETLTKKKFWDDLTHLWIYQMNENASTYRNKEVGEAIKSFVQKGGNLILSMEAARLLNDWGVEKNPFQVQVDSVKDNGFGRPLGFHAFKSHPVFQGLHGGAYPWKAKEDHQVRKIGFFGEQLPDTAKAKVLGIEWTYITFHEDNKLVLEYQLGKGKIMAIGAFTYFGRPNYNTHELQRFYANIITYMAEQDDEVNAHYWDYSTRKVLPLSSKLPTMPVVSATQWSLPKPTIQLHEEKTSEAPVIMTGRRMMLMGKQKGGIDEIWTHPFMAFRDVFTGVKLKNGDEVVWLNDLEPAMVTSPEILIREYRLGESTLKEITTVSMDEPFGVVHYEWQGDAIEQLYIKYTTNFRYMWPYSSRVASTLRYQWQSEGNVAMATAQSNSLVGMLGFSTGPDALALGQYDGFRWKDGIPKGVRTESQQVSGFFVFDANKTKGKLNTYFFAGEDGLDDALGVYKRKAKGFNTLFETSSDYYRNLLGNSLSITTPDPQFNTGYQWALLRTDQFFQETPGIGTTMVAGSGTTERGWDGGQKISGRPGYAWYFGRDAQWCGFAVNAYGGQGQVRKILDVFEAFQNLNGKVFHELTTSGAVHYDASDATPLYVALAAHYLKYTGDVDFIRQKWPSLKKAMDFCYSTDTDGDGLIEITNVGHGWVEGGALFGTHTEVYLAGCWAAALDAASYMAGSLGKTKLSQSYKEDAEKVKNSIDRDFWDSDGNYFYVGKEKDGSYREEESVLAAVPIYFDAVLDLEKARETSARWAGNGYSTDWGVRILPESSKNFNPISYHAGMVWPLFSGWAALAEYRTGRYTSAYQHIMNNLLVYNDWNLGSVEETLNGMRYEPAGVCSQQGWSQTMVLQPIYEGMLGLAPDVMDNTLSLAPRFPWHWGEVKVENIPFGKEKIGFGMERGPESTKFVFNGSLKKGLSLDFSPAFPLGTVIEDVLVDGKSVDFAREQAPEGIMVYMKLSLGSGTNVEVLHHSGIGAVPLVYDPEPGNTTQGAKIVGQSFSDRQFDILLEGLPGNTYQFEIISNFKIRKIQNGKVVNGRSNRYTIETVLPSSPQKYMERKVTVHLKYKSTG